VFWLAVSFLVLFTLMSKVALPGVENVLETRRRQREGDLAEAERASAEADKVRKSFEASLGKAQEAAASHIAAAEQDVAAKIAEDTSKFGEGARKRIATAEQNIAKAKQEALASLADISAELAADMAGKVGGLQVGKAEARQAVTSLMQKAS
jgi:F-type H+-transporting ATPase subunit b